MYLFPIVKYVKLYTLLRDCLQYLLILNPIPFDPTISLLNIQPTYIFTNAVLCKYYAVFLKRNIYI